MNHQQPQVVLADTFPAKAHLLITYLTQTNPNVCSFSPDGTSFYVYNQATFAQSLPQYFKHNNYGSFVRQLNLYGFNSSRLKDNNDVVEWKHDNFHRDRKDLVNDIKRTKKFKSSSSSSKPSHVHVDPRASSPGISYSDEASSSLADSDAAATSPRKVLNKKVSGTDYDWLAAEFSVMKRQNESLERKLDTLLQITLRINPGINLEQAEHPGEKRRRTSPVESGGYSYGEEERKISDPDHFEIEPVPYNDARKMPHHNPNEKADDNEMGDSLTAFIDLMLNEEESKTEQDDSLRAAATSNNTTNGCLHNHHEDELMEEALTANLPESTLNTDGDLFGIDENEPSPRNSSGHGIFAITNAAMDKADGPEPIEVISSSVPTYDGLADIEEANMPIGVHVISAQAELVQNDDGNGDRRHKKRVVCLLGVLVVAVVAFVVTLPAVIITQKNSNKKKTLIIKRPCGLGGKDRHDCIPQRPLESYDEQERPSDSHDEASHDGYLNDDGYYYYPMKDDAENQTMSENTNTSTITDSSISPQPQLAQQSVRYKDNSFSADDESISVTIQGVAYECSNI